MSDSGSKSSSQEKKDPDAIEPVNVPLVEPNLKYNARGSYQPPGYKPASKETLIPTLQVPNPDHSSDTSSSEDRATKRRSYVPVGFVLERPASLNPSNSSTSSSSDVAAGTLDAKSKDANKRKSYVPPIKLSNNHHHGPLVKVDLKRPVSFSGGFASLSPTSGKKKDVVPRSKTLFDKSRASISKNKRASYMSNKSRSSQHSASSHPTLINLEAGVGIISKAKAIDHSIVAQYKPDDPSYFLDPESMATLRAVFCFLTAGYIGWCLYYQHYTFFSNLLGWCWIGYFFYFLLSLAETLWFLDEHQTLMFPYQPEITEVLFVCVSALAFTVPFIYWTFVFYVYIGNLIQKIPVQLSMLQVQDLIGVHLALFIIIPEIFLSRREVDKMFAVAPSIAILAYQFLVWILHYTFNWDWPYALSSYFVNYLAWDMNPMSLFLAFMISSLMTATCTIFVYLCCYIRKRFQKLKIKREEEKKNAI